MERFRRWTVLMAILGLVNSFGSGPIAVEAGIKLVDRVVFGNDPIVGLSYDGEPSDEITVITPTRMYGMECSEDAGGCKIDTNVTIPNSYRPALAVLDDYGAGEFAFYFVPAAAPNKLLHVQYSQGKWSLAQTLTLIKAVNSSTNWTTIQNLPRGPVVIASADVLCAVVESSVFRLWLHDYDEGGVYTDLSGVAWNELGATMYIARGTPGPGGRGQLMSVQFDGQNGFDFDTLVTIVSWSKPLSIWVPADYTQENSVFWTAVEPSSSGAPQGIVYAYNPPTGKLRQLNVTFAATENWAKGFAAFYSGYATEPEGLYASGNDPEDGTTTLRSFILDLPPKKGSTLANNGHTLPIFGITTANPGYDTPPIAVFATRTFPGLQYEISAWTFQIQKSASGLQKERVAAPPATPAFMHAKRNTTQQPRYPLLQAPPIGDNGGAPDGCDPKLTCNLNNRCPVQPTKPVKCYGPINQAFYCCWSDPF